MPFHDLIEKEKREQSLARKLDLLLRTGQMLLQSGADSNRIDRNLRRAALFLGIDEDKFHLHITYTTLMLNINDGLHSITKFRKCSGHKVNMTTVSAVSRLTWHAMEHQYSFDRFEKELDRIENIGHHYPEWLVILSVGLACGGFCLLFGSDWAAVCISTVAASMALFVRRRLHKKVRNNYAVIAAAAFVATLISCLAAAFHLSETPERPVFASVLFLIPGVPLINSLDDMIDGFTIVGFTRGLVASLSIVALAFGMTVAFKALHTPAYKAAFIVPNIWFCALGGAVAAAGFAILFNVPLRTLALCMAGGAIAAVTKNLLTAAEVSLPLATFCASLAAGIWTIYWVHKVHTPGYVISIPSVIPLVPGVLAYKAMMGLFAFTAFSQRTTDVSKIEPFIQLFEPGIKSILSVLGISLGVAIPNILDRFYSSKKKRSIEDAFKEKNKIT
ncbi:threonine/serine exporter family protein [Pinibacter aurantiacus]|uniref:Threonine/serine exporter family protein n=1 Tax=Pinibacter aurantiacus TaxID=2851599 RepID=A0A9E2W7X4_9BACT|nr:threonine/serine exporter family protein [Pinibacter aurantiacus]MBV4357421.1 threonine/serine exporter family protein [Pinibacter aurantiacus]